MRKGVLRIYCERTDNKELKALKMKRTQWKENKIIERAKDLPKII
jgi:hypothetical protein